MSWCQLTSEFLGTLRSILLQEDIGLLWSAKDLYQPTATDIQGFWLWCKGFQVACRTVQALKMNWNPWSSQKWQSSTVWVQTAGSNRTSCPSFSRPDCDMIMWQSISKKGRFAMDTILWRYVTNYEPANNLLACILIVAGVEWKMVPAKTGLARPALRLCVHTLASTYTSYFPLIGMFCVVLYLVVFWHTNSLLFSPFSCWLVHIYFKCLE